jgi:hypothetical protein
MLGYNIFFCYGACGGFCRVTQELYLAPSFGSMLSPHFPYLGFESRRQAGSSLRINWLRSIHSRPSLVKSLISGKEFRLVQEIN